MPVLALESKTGREFTPALIVFPHFIIPRLPRLSPQRTLFVDVSLFV